MNTPDLPGERIADILYSHASTALEEALPGPHQPGIARQCLHPASDLYVQESTGHVRCRGCNRDWSRSRRSEVSRKNPRAALAAREDFSESYPDTGCIESPTCLTCPLPFCKYDDPARYRAIIQARKDTITLAQGGTRKLVAQRLGVTERTVYKRLARVTSHRINTLSGGE